MRDLEVEMEERSLFWAIEMLLMILLPVTSSSKKFGRRSLVGRAAGATTWPGDHSNDQILSLTIVRCDDGERPLQRQFFNSLFNATPSHPNA